MHTLPWNLLVNSCLIIATKIYIAAAEHELVEMHSLRHSQVIAPTFFFIYIIAQMVLNLNQLYYKITLQSAKVVYYFYYLHPGRSCSPKIKCYPSLVYFRSHDDLLIMNYITNSWEYHQFWKRWPNLRVSTIITSIFMKKVPWTFPY